MKDQEKPKKEVRTCWLLEVYECTENGVNRGLIGDPACNTIQFQTQADCTQWVREHGEKGKYYSYHEVDYIV